MDIRVSFPGGKRVDAAFDGFVLHTDQPPDLGGEGAFPAPFDLFLASMATCAGIFALGFCQARGLPTEGLAIVQRDIVDPETKRPGRFEIELTLPDGFPEKYRGAIQRAVEACKVKKVMAANPPVDVIIVSQEASCAGV